MRRLHFPLEGLRQVRLIQERVAQARLAQAVASLESCDAAIARLHESLAQIAKNLAMGQGDPIGWSRQVTLLGARIDQARLERNRLEKLVRECQALRAKAETETEKIQILRDRAQESWKREAQRDAQTQLEDRLLGRWHLDRLDDAPGLSPLDGGGP